MHVILNPNENVEVWLDATHPLVVHLCISTINFDDGGVMSMVMKCGEYFFGAS